MIPSVLNIVVIAGIETIYRDGKFVKTSSTFRNNADTIAYDEKKNGHKVVIVDARDHVAAEHPINSLWDSVTRAFVDTSKPAIDRLFISCHSDWEGLYIFSKIRKELPETARYLDKRSNWIAEYARDAEIHLHGCRTAGDNGKSFEVCVAQDIACSSGCKVFGYASKTSQHRRADGRYYQKPDRAVIFSFLPKTLDDLKKDK